MRYDFFKRPGETDFQYSQRMPRAWVFHDGAPPMTIRFGATEQGEICPPARISATPRAATKKRAAIPPFALPDEQVVRWLRASLGYTVPTGRAREVYINIRHPGKLETHALSYPVFNPKVRLTQEKTAAAARFYMTKEFALQSPTDWYVANMVYATKYGIYNSLAPHYAEAAWAFTHNSYGSFRDLAVAVNEDRLAGAKHRGDPDTFDFTPWTDFADENERSIIERLVWLSNTPALIMAFVTAARALTGEDPTVALFNAVANDTVVNFY